jgi:hypothetical protein
MAAKWKGPRPSQFDDEIKKRMNALLRQAVLQTDTLLKQESPVDTGRFRNSWQIGENATGQYEGPAGTSIQPPNGINYMVGNEQIGNSYIIHNSLPYAEKLATAAPGSGGKTQVRYNPRRTVKTWGTAGKGSSIQTNGPGWIEQISKDMQSWINQNAGNIK